VSTTYLVYCLSLGEESLNEKVDWRGDISVSAPRRGRESPLPRSVGDGEG
jgi:hypothetical protein